MSDAFETEDVQEQFVAGAMLTGAAYNRDKAREWFAEWLAQVKAEAQVEALREASMEFFGDGEGEWDGFGVSHALTLDADRIAREAGIETKGAGA